MAKARLQVSARQWTAERWNAEFAPGKGADVTVNITQLHLEALRALNASDTILWTTVANAWSHC